MIDGNQPANSLTNENDQLWRILKKMFICF